jgi:hypothetical protein
MCMDTTKPDFTACVKCTVLRQKCYWTYFVENVMLLKVLC